MDSARALALARMGIDRYVLRAHPDAHEGAPAQRVTAHGTSVPDDAAAAPTPAVGAAAGTGRAVPPASAPAASADWDALTADIAACRACALCQTRTQTVPGVGLRQARWLVVGEAPGQEEDERGEPFVGRAGKLLDAMLYAVGLDRTSCYIANILKCRPPANRNPTPDEAAACRPFLDRQIALIAPRLILAVGAVPARHLLQTEVAVGKLRGQVHRLPGTDIPLVVTYHPAYLLRSPLEKRKVWGDLCLARDAVAPT